MKLCIFWFRRDLRLEDNTALTNALKSGFPVLPIFIFDKEILSRLSKNDPRVNFVHARLQSMNNELKKMNSSLLCAYGHPLDVWRHLISKYNIHSVYFNREYEPSTVTRDKKIKKLLTKCNIEVKTFKDQVIFEANEILRGDKSPITERTPYKNKWLKLFHKKDSFSFKKPRVENFHKFKYRFLSLAELGFLPSSIKVKPYSLKNLIHYPLVRDMPAKDSTTYLGPHLRFGTVSVRQIVSKLGFANDLFLGELIWRDFLTQILSHFPHIINQNFNIMFDHIEWRNNEHEFYRWCNGNTGYPIVDAGMRQLNETGYMNGYIRMITASFLCKHLLIDWRWGEAYFAQKLLDYEPASNSGNWQHIAGTGCDAIPYSRVLDPIEQSNKIDEHFEYVSKWVPEFREFSYINPIIRHKVARLRALSTYKEGIATYYRSRNLKTG